MGKLVKFTEYALTTRLLGINSRRSSTIKERAEQIHKASETDTESELEDTTLTNVEGTQYITATIPP